MRVGNGPSGIAYGEGRSGSRTASRGPFLGSTRGEPGRRHDRRRERSGRLAYADGSVWVANSGDHTITQVDVGTDKPSKTLEIGGRSSRWVTERCGPRDCREPGRAHRSVDRGRPDDRGRERTDGHRVRQRSGWVANSLDGTLSRIDPETNSVVAVTAVGRGPTAVDHRCARRLGEQPVRRHARANRSADEPSGRRIRSGTGRSGVAISGGDVVVSVGGSGAPSRRHADGAKPRDRQFDRPGVAYSTTEWLLLRMTNDGLVAFNETSGLAGARLVPDLAVSLPTPTDGGKTYAFRLRPNIHYSTGGIVKASDVRATIERGFEIGCSCPYYDGIVGAARCKHDPRRCDLSKGIVDRRRANRHLPSHRGRSGIPLQARTAIRRTSSRRAPRLDDVGTHPLPATGPYVIAGYRPKHVIRARTQPVDSTSGRRRRSPRLSERDPCSRSAAPQTKRSTP